MIEDDADRAAFLDTSNFGVLVVYTLQGGAPVSFSGLLSNASSAVDGLAGPSTILTEAGLTVRAADVPVGAGAGDTVVIGAVNYSVRAVMPEGTGLAHIVLERT